METISHTSSLIPTFTESEMNILKKYYEYNQKYVEELSEALTNSLLQDPLWGPILSSMTPEMSKQQNLHSQELQRAAIFEGRWEEYANNLMVQGVAYARMNVSYADWYKLIKMYKSYLTPYIYKDFDGRMGEAITFLEGLSILSDFAMYTIAEAYFNEKNNIIQSKSESFRAIFENSADYILLVDRNFIITMINHVSSRFTMADVVGNSILGFHLDEFKGLVRESITSVFETKTPINYSVFNIIEGKKEYFSSSVSPIFDREGAVSCVVVITRNITLQKVAEEEIRELNATLERKVNERTQELNTINKELESFCYSVSHDLRSPLRAINGFSQILSDDHSELLNEEAKDALHEITSNSLRMGKLIDDLLEFSRIGKQGIIKSTIDMNELVDSIISETQNAGMCNKVSFTITHLEKAKGDRGMLKQVMVNLISNAIKYSANEDHPVIEIGSYADGGNNVYYVKDNGVGFDMRYYEKLFGVFQRLHSSSEFEGTGVGLAIVHRIISRHEGHVWGEGKVGEGASFYMSLPN